MNLSRTLPERRTDLPDLLQKALLALAAALLTLFLSAAIFTLGLRLAYANRALPGVSVAGVSVEGLTQPEIELALGQALTYPTTGTILFRDGERSWVARPAEVGVVVDAPEMARRALSVGRMGTLVTRLGEQYQAWFRGFSLPPIVIFDQRAGTAYLQGLGGQIDLPTEEAQLGLNGTEVLVLPGQVGRKLDIPATLEALTPAVQQLHDAEIGLVVAETPPYVLDASAEADLARRILSEPLSLTAEGAGPWVIAPANLAEMLRFNIVQADSGSKYAIGISPLALSNFLEPVAPELQRGPENARFYFDDDTHELVLIQPAVIGRTLDLPATTRAVDAALLAGEHDVPLAFDTEQPAVGDDATAASLGITENIVTVSTYFNGSSPERVQNIQTAAGAFHGMLIAPGATLSMADVLGDISLDKGYAEALIIFGNRTIKGVGGGVCQVSTTLYRAAFFSGMPIVERNPHAYRVLYYEQGPNSPGPGMDATVFVPLVDFKFTNDSPNWLLMETYVYGTQLVWKFYSTSDGRTVQWHSSGPQDVVEAPKPLYKENPNLKEGEIKQVDYEADGMDVAVTRTVLLNGQVLFEDVFKTHYLPWRAIYEYGPGTDLPKGAKTESD